MSLVVQSPGLAPASSAGAPTGFRLGYRPSLDGLRGVAILLVLLTHGQVLGTGFAFFAVNTFFVLSGFLITCLLLEEYELSGSISLRRFYLRRALRLLPALLAMLLVFVAFAFLMDPRKRALREVNEALCALFYCTNWASIWGAGRHVSLAHTWSLSVEEQFYIVWPVILLLLLRKSSRSSLLCWLVLAAFLGALLRLTLFVAGSSNVAGNILPIAPQRLIAGTDTRADALLLGCVAGVVLSSNWLAGRPWLERPLKVAAAAAGVGLLALGVCPPDSPWLVCVGWSLGSLLAMTLIMHLVLGPRSGVHLLLESRLLVYLGRLSYGLYVWHYPVLLALQQHHLPWRHLVYLAPVLPLVLLSYYGLEKPCLQFKSRWR